MSEGKKRKLKYYELTAMEVLKLQVEYQFGTPLHTLSTVFKVDRRSIKHLASTRGWGEHGGKRDEFIGKAVKDVRSEISEAYADIVKEVNERQLKLYRTATSLAVGLMKDMQERLQQTRAENARILADAEVKGVMPKLISTAREAYTLNHICDILKKSMIEGERYILGLKEGTFGKPDPSNGASEIARVLAEARATYGDDSM